MPRLGFSFHEVFAWAPDTPHISFRASMKNVSGHTVEWAVQSVSQYDAGNPKDPSHSNHEILGIYSVESIQWILESLSRSHGSS